RIKERKDVEDDQENDGWDNRPIADRQIGPSLSFQDRSSARGHRHRRDRLFQRNPSALGGLDKLKKIEIAQEQNAPARQATSFQKTRFFESSFPIFGQAAHGFFSRSLVGNDKGMPALVGLR